ncbi:hypothetical protein ACHQM5_016696 [Ranunculus cassubicifolius]
MANTSQHRCVFVGNIPYDATEEQLVQICEEVGPVVSFRLVIDRETGKPKGYGFCEYKDEETALSARRNLQGYEINGRQLRVDFAENDKGADRSREQGRGGPGMSANVDAPKSSGGPAIVGVDTTLYQPIGLPLSSTAASVMAGALGGVQADSMLSSTKQNGLQKSDPLTLYLANMSRKQLYDVISEMKVMTTQNKELARQLLSLCPLLLKAVFQAQIILGMVTPQVLQMSNIRQPSSLLPHSTLPDGIQNNNTMPRVAHEPQNNPPPVVSLPQVSLQPRFQQPGLSTLPPLRPVTGLPLGPQPSAVDLSSVPKQAMLPVAHNTFQNPAVPRPLPAQPNIQETWPPPDSMHRPSKLARLDDGRSGAGLTQVPRTEVVQEKHVLQLAPDVQSALLEQVKSLTPEQLSSLPPEQRQQVLDLQKMLQ